jgi:hypothetical protein
MRPVIGNVKDDLLALRLVEAAISGDIGSCVPHHAQEADARITARIQASLA